MPSHGVRFQQQRTVKLRAHGGALRPGPGESSDAASVFPLRGLAHPTLLCN